MAENQVHKSFFSNAKLMMSGEYLVLEGATALALPLRLGQELVVNKSIRRSALAWKTFVRGNHWFDAYFSLPDLAIANTNDFPTAQNLRDIFMAARELNPDFPDPDFHYEISSKLDFDISWGLGSSSSLLSNISKWAQIDPFELHFKVSGGSGYDIASAISNNPILYKLEEGKPHYNETPFYPSFSEHLYFAYLGRKKRSDQAVREFKQRNQEVASEVEEISSISEQLARTSSLIDFNKLLKEHDEIVSKLIKVKPISKSRFSDFKGYVKSLGAWGGDFALFVTDYPKDYLLNYLRRKDIKTWFGYKEIVKSINPGVNV